MTKWTPISELPEELKKPGTRIVGLCKHDADVGQLPDGKLTTYMAHAEMFGHVEDGEHVLEWGGEYSDHDEYSGCSWTLPNWWFRTDTDFEQAAFPTHFVLLPETEQ
jgi:hypothetical protein